MCIFEGWQQCAKKFYKRLHLNIEVNFNYKGGRRQIFKELHVSNYICSLE